MNTANKPALVDIYNEVVTRDTYNFRNIAVMYPEFTHFVDFGASFGPASKFIKTLWPRAHVYSFEPDKERFALLEENLTEFSNVTCFNVGACGINKAHVGFDGYRYRKTPESAWDNALCVGSGKPVDLTGNEFQLKHVLDVWPDRVDLLKIDVEGFEWGIIEDLTSAKRLPSVIAGEWHFNNCLAALIQLLEPTHRFVFRHCDSNPWGAFWAFSDPARLIL